MNAAQRSLVRAELDQSRRATLKPAARPGQAKSPVVRAAEHAQRASEAKPLMAAIVEERAGDLARCQWCGGPSPKNDGVCPGHRDLGGLQ